MEKTTFPSLPDMLALMPCGLRNPFKTSVENHLQNHPEWYEGMNYIVEGNLNHETRYYPEIDQIESANELPDIILSSDVNSFLHRRFQEHFADTGFYTDYRNYTPNSYLDAAGYCDPEGHYTAFTANLLIFAVDETRLNGRPMPTCWADLLDPAFENDIIIRGEDDFFCNAVLLPYFKEMGLDAIRALALNVKSGRHPSEMVKMAGSDREDAATVYIMPFFFASKIRSQKVTIVWPKDGAILSPVFLLVRKDRIEKHKRILDYIFSKETAEMLVNNLAPTLHPEVSNEVFPGKVKWLGWDFLRKYDVEAVKKEIQDTFMAIWKKRGADTDFYIGK
jgi:ABC-type Fe3+ transport system substrate-binding protein